MFNVIVTLTKTKNPTPLAAQVDHTNLVVTDFGGAVQNFVLNNQSSPPWSQLVSNLADGQASFVATDVDTNSMAVNAPTTGTYSPGAAGGNDQVTSGMTFAAA